MKKIYCVIVVLLILFTMVGCDNNTSNKPYFEPTEETVSEETTEKGTTIKLTPPTETVKEETTNKITEITDNPFEFTFEHIGEEFPYSFTAEITGVYRFDFGTYDSECDYRVKLTDKKNKVIFETCYSTYENGISRTLTKGETYKLVVTQHEGFTTGKITIGIPNEEMNVESNEINGQFTYTDQENIYNYHSNLEGVYRFDFLTNDVICDYKVKLINNINYTEFDTCYSTYYNGKTATLEANTDYRIIITQTSGLPKYEIKIHEPLPIENVNGTFSGEISFIDQKNIYEFTPKESGDYKVNLNFGDKECYCSLTLKNDINSKLLSSVSSERVCIVKLEKGKKYKFVIEYGNGFLKYDVNIEKVIENETQ